MVCPSGVIGPYDYRISQMGQLFVNFLKGNQRAYMMELMTSSMSEMLQMELFKPQNMEKVVKPIFYQVK